MKIVLYISMMVLIFVAFIVIYLISISNKIFSCRNQIMITGFSIIISLIALYKLDVFAVRSEIERIYFMFFPPADYFACLGCQTLVDGKNEYSIRLKHKYAGSHCIDMEFPFFVPFGELRFSTLTIDASFKVDGIEKIVFTNSPALPCWSVANYHLMYCRYDVPHDLPRDTPITVSIKLSDEWKDVVRRVKGLKVCLKKLSDE